MDWLLWLIWTVWMTGSLLSLANAVLYARFRKSQDQRWLDPGLSIDQKKVCWIVPMKGFDKDLTLPFIESLIQQDYSDFRIIIAFESEHDAGYLWLREHFQLEGDCHTWNPEKNSGLENVELLVAGPSQDCGQKVHNQLAAMATLTEEDRIIAFADADIICNQDSLSGLVAPINLGHFEVTTTFRWLIPEDAHPASLFGSVINAASATMGGHIYLNTLWGGMMALDRTTFDDLKVTERCARVLSDDLKLNRMVKSSGRTIGFVRSLIVPSPVKFTWGGLFEFGRRQFFMVKFYSIRLYLSAYSVTGAYIAGFTTSILAIACLDNPFAWIPLGFVMIADQVRALYRRKIYRHQFRDDQDMIRSLDKTAWVEHLATPIWMAMILGFVLSVLFKREITWAGIRYRVKIGGDTEVVSRHDTSLRSPS